MPPKIRVRGPASFIKTLDYVQTDKIDLTGKKEEFTAKQISVNVSNPKAAVLNTVVDVFFRIGEKRIEKTFTVSVSGQNSGKKATVVLYASRTMLAKIHADELKVEIVKSETGDDQPQLILSTEMQDVVEIRKLKVN